MAPNQTQCPGGPPVYDLPGCPLLFSCLRAIKKLATIVDNGNSKSNIKLTIISRKIPIKANSVLIDSESYIIYGGPVLWFSLYPLYPGGPPDNDEGKYPLLYFFNQRFNQIGYRC